jgi:hypothetical protein
LLESVVIKVVFVMAELPAKIVLTQIGGNNCLQRGCAEVLAQGFVGDGFMVLGEQIENVIC